MITGKWLVLTVLIFIMIFFNLICFYGAVEHQDSIYEWMNWTLFRWIFVASTAAVGMMTLVIWLV